MTLKYSSIFTFLNAYCSSFPVFLKPPVGGVSRARSLPSLLAALIRAKPERRRALLFSSGFFFFFFFFIDYPGIFGGLTWSKTLENLHTHWNPRQLGTPLRLGPGRGTEALQRPLEHHQKNLMNSSHILARIHIETRYTYRSHQAEQLLRCMSWAPPNRKSAIQGCLKITCSGIWNTPPRIFNTRAPKPGERDLKTLGMLNCGGIFDISNGLPVARRWSYGENWETGSV